MKNKITTLRFSAILALSFVTAGFMTSCDTDLFRDELPDANSIEDTFLPQADFSFAIDEDVFTTVYFSNISSESNAFTWDFGDGTTSTEIDPTHMYADLGIYAVTLSSSDANGEVSSITRDVVVAEPIIPDVITPIIYAAGFENGVEYPCSDRDDARDCWLNNDFGGILQQSTDPVNSGDRAGKFPAGTTDIRVGYQDGIELTPFQDYQLIYFYTLTEVAGTSMTVSIIADGEYDTIEDAQAAAIVTFTGSDVADGDIYTRAALVFNSGSNAAIGILITKDGDGEGRMDDFEIEPIL